MAEERNEPYQKNAPGPFYVQDGECISCGAPEQAAPDLISFDNNNNHCYFSKQPMTSQEVSRSIRAVWVSCCGALRYSGDDSEILKRLSDIGLTDRCDKPLAIQRSLVVRNCVAFSFHCNDSAHQPCEREIAQYIAAGLVRAVPQIKVRWRSRLLPGTRFVYTWYKGHGIKLGIETVLSQEETFLLRLKGQLPETEISNAMLIDDILRGEARFGNIRWYTEYDWLSGGKKWNHLPY